jgi:outer membrane lipoprotein LolB
MRKLVLLFILLPFMSLLCSCATTSSPHKAYNKKVSWKQRQKKLLTIKKWETSGKISITTPTDSVSASFVWNQATKRQYSIQLFGPLGSGNAVLTGTALGEVNLKTADGKVFSARSPENVLRKALNILMPVTPLYYWFRGIPSPNIPKVIKLDQFNHVLALQQAGWTVRYLRYTGVKNMDLPSKILLLRKDMRIKLIIQNWGI